MTKSTTLLFDGFYAWVQPAASTWLTDGTEWGHDYLTWFYSVMAGLAPTYTNKVAIGGVWPGFDDLKCSVGSEPLYVAALWADLARHMAVGQSIQSTLRDD